MAKKGKKKKGSAISVDFSGVEGRIKLKEGDYKAKVVKVTEEEGTEHPYLKWEFEMAGNKKGDGAKAWYNTSLAPNSLWNLRNLLEALGVEVPDSEMDLDLEEFEDKEILLTIGMGEYQGKPRSEIVDFAPVDGDDEDGEVEDDEDEEEEDEDDDKKSKKSKDKKKSKKSDDDDEDEEDEDSEEEDEDEEDDRKSKKKGSKKSKKKDDEDEEEEESEEGLTRDEVEEMGTDELKDVIKKHKLKVELEGSTRKKRNIVIAALEKKGLLSD